MVRWPPVTEATEATEASDARERVRALLASWPETGLDRKLVAEVLEGGYRLVAPKRAIAALDRSREG